jgi:hypothetical protein
MWPLCLTTTVLHTRILGDKPAALTWLTILALVTVGAVGAERAYTGAGARARNKAAITMRLNTISYKRVFDIGTNLLVSLKIF